MKVPGNVRGFDCANFPSSRDLGFAAAECRLVRASVSITVTGAKKCLFYLGCFRADGARVKRNITLESAIAQSWLKPMAALPQNVRREEKNYWIASIYFLSSTVVF